PYEPVTVSGVRSHGATGPHTHRAVHEPFSSLLEVRMVVGWALARGGRRHALVFLEVVFLAPGRGVLGAPRVTRDVGGWGGGRNTGSSRRCSKGQSVFALVTAGGLVIFLSNVVIFLPDLACSVTNMVLVSTN